MDNWIEEMIEREAIPKPLRKETTTAFCARHNIASSTYFYELRKKENWSKVEDLCFKQARKHTPEVLENLGDRAKKDTKSAEVFLEFILERSKKSEVKQTNLNTDVELSPEEYERTKKALLKSFPQEGGGE